MTGRPGSLFHTIVIIGASLGCGGSVSRDASPTGGDGGPDGGPSTNRDSGTTRDSATTGADAALAPTSFCDCPRPGSFRCTTCASGTPPVLGRCPQYDGVGCLCDPTIAIAAPSDCPTPGQFACHPTSISMPLGLPYTGWFAFADCTCDPSPPTSQASCGDAGMLFQCTAGDGCPASSPGALNVSFACKCVPPPIPIQ